MSVGQWPADRIAAKSLQRVGVDPSELDPLTLLALAQLVVSIIKLMYECHTRPTTNDIRSVCRKPTGVQWVVVSAKAKRELGAEQYRKLGGRRLVDAAFAEVLDSSDADLCSMLYV